MGRAQKFTRKRTLNEQYSVRSCNNTYVIPQVRTLMRAQLSANQAKSVRTILPFTRTILRPPASRSGDAELALEDAGEIREIVDAACVSDGLDQCFGLCTVKHSSPRAYALGSGFAIKQMHHCKT